MASTFLPSCFTKASRSLTVVWVSMPALMRSASCFHSESGAAFPFAFFGGSISLPSEVYRPILGTLLLVSAAYLAWSTVVDPERF